MSWNVGTTEPIPKSQVSVLPTPDGCTPEQREQFNAAVLAAASLATLAGSDQHLVSVSMNGNSHGISVTVTADHLPDPIDKVPYPDADLVLPDDRAAKRLARGQVVDEEPPEPEPVELTPKEEVGATDTAVKEPTKMKRGRR